MKKWLQKLWNAKSRPSPTAIGATQDGNIHFAVGVNRKDKKVVVLFNEPIAALELDEYESERLAVLLKRKAAIIRAIKTEELFE